MDSERAERARLELEARHRQEAEEEASRQLRLQEAQSEHEKIFVEGLERAKQEAEVLRKARLFKHVLMADDTTTETVHRLLGTEDPGLVQHAMKELGQFERHKRLEKESAVVSTSSPKGGQSAASGAGSAKKTPSSVGEKKHASPRPPSPLSGGGSSAGRSPLTRAAVGRQSLRVQTRGKKDPPAPTDIKRRSNSSERVVLNVSQVEVEAVTNVEERKQVGDRSSTSTITLERPSLVVGMPPMPALGPTIIRGAYHPSNGVGHDTTIRLLKGLPESERTAVKGAAGLVSGKLF